MLSGLSIRARVALSTAALCGVVLASFAAVTAGLVERRLRNDFSAQVRAGADGLRSQLIIDQDPFGRLRLRPDVDLYAASNGAFAQVVFADGRDLARSDRTPKISGRPRSGTVSAAGFRVETKPLPLVNGGLVYVRYGLPGRPVDATVRQIRLLLLLGVLAGTALAGLGASWLARRSLRPIAELTEAAERVERTRDPDMRVPIPPAGDEVSRLAIALDEMLEALDEASTETEEALARQRRFVADASHELRTPLTSVLANLEFLADALRGDEGEAAGAALRSSRRMRRLVEDLLLLARADAGRQPLPRTPTDLGSVLVEAAAELHPQAGGHELEVDPRSAVVLGTRDELHRVCVNLIGNAFAHTPPGTNVRASTFARDGRAVLEVADDGPGVPPEMRDRVFDRFVRGAGDRGGKGRASSGLGLAIVRAVAEAHGGTVRLAAAETQGARFVVELPLASHDALRAAGAPPPTLPHPVA